MKIYNRSDRRYNINLEGEYYEVLPYSTVILKNKHTENYVRKRIECFKNDLVLIDADQMYFSEHDLDQDGELDFVAEAKSYNASLTNQTVANDVVVGNVVNYDETNKLWFRTPPFITPMGYVNKIKDGLAEIVFYGMVENQNIEEGKTYYTHPTNNGELSLLTTTGKRVGTGFSGGKFFINIGVNFPEYFTPKPPDPSSLPKLYTFDEYIWNFTNPKSYTFDDIDFIFQNPKTITFEEITFDEESILVPNINTHYDSKFTLAFGDNWEEENGVDRGFSNYCVYLKHSEESLWYFTGTDFSKMKNYSLKTKVFSDYYYYFNLILLFGYQTVAENGGNTNSYNYCNINNYNNTLTIGKMNKYGEDQILYQGSLRKRATSERLYNFKLDWKDNEIRLWWDNILLHGGNFPEFNLEGSFGFHHYPSNGNKIRIGDIVVMELV